ncbi:MAG: arginine--tRNA ligase [Bdellovibrionales bacterium]|nr:arginine--tRNA ligase [Bdellovibrionales bacterium]
MKKNHDEIRSLAAVEIQQGILVLGSELQIPIDQISTSQIAEALVEAPSSVLGDLAYGCFSLAKQFKKSPAEIAKRLADILVTQEKTEKSSSAGQVSGLRSAQAVGPYLNLFFTAATYERLLLNPIVTPSNQPEVDPKTSLGTYFQAPIYSETPRTMVEFSQPNTHKEMHVGHMRNLCLGDALIRLHRFAGYEIISSTYPGDVGTHVAKCLWYMKTHNKEDIPFENRGEWLGRMYSLAHLRLEEEVGTPQEALNREALTTILRQLEQKDGEYFELWKTTRAWSIDLMKQVYAWAGVSFDMWYWESDVDAESIKYVNSLFHQNKLVQSQGAIGMNLEAEGLGFCLLLKTDGTGLYATKDLELARRKFQDFKIEKSIYVVDLRQALHFKQVFKVLEKLGFPQANNCYHLQYNYVELPDGPMSSRKGNIIPITQLISKMQEIVKNNFLNRYVGDWSQEEIDLVASQVAKGAIKYGMLRIDTNKKIVFDMEEWLKIDGESGPFIQYSVARIQSLCLKFGYQPGPIQAELLCHPTEKEILAHLLNFKSVVGRCVEGLSPSSLCTYLYQLAKKFNHFYHECSIGQAETEELKQARLKLVKASGEVLKTGLRLLGIPSPERM